MVLACGECRCCGSLQEEGPEWGAPSSVCNVLETLRLYLFMETGGRPRLGDGPRESAVDTRSAPTAMSKELAALELARLEAGNVCGCSSCS